MDTIFLTNIQLVNSSEPFKVLNAIALPIKTSFRIGVLAEQLMSLYKVYAAQKSKIEIKWAKKDDFGNVMHPIGSDGNPVFNEILVTDINGFATEMNELNNCINEVPFKKLKEEDLGNVNIPPSVIIDLNWLFDLSK